MGRENNAGWWKDKSGVRRSCGNAKLHANPEIQAKERLFIVKLSLCGAKCAFPRVCDIEEAIVGGVLRLVVRVYYRKDGSRGGNSVVNKDKYGLLRAQLGK
jgi:hypothetical protein